MFAGAKGTSYSALLPGQDDEVVAYHSSGGVSGSSGGVVLQSGRLVLQRPDDRARPGRRRPAKWSYHTVAFRDDGESYGHYLNGNWGGIVGRMLPDMVTLATE